MRKNFQSLAAIILFAFSSIPVFSQWTQRKNLTGIERTFATSFTVNNTIYVVGGYDETNILNDVWAYNPTTDSWTKKKDFPGGNRKSATAFSIGNKAYMGTGHDGAKYLNDFWEYEPLTDTWTQKADFPSYEREEAVGFSIGNKGYLGTGQTFVSGPNSSWTTTYNDFYEYDPTTNTWIQKDSLPGPRAYAVGIGSGNKGYLGFGGNNDQSESYKDFYEYDPATNHWTAKASMSGVGRADAGIVANGKTIYIIGGINFPGFHGFATCQMFNTQTNTWEDAPDFSAGTIIAPVVQNANGRIFAGTGYNEVLAPGNDWWEFTSLPTSTNNLEEKQSMVFPNPFLDELNLKLAKNTSKLSIEIIDIQGKLVYSATQKMDDRATIKINTTDFLQGIYLFRIKNSLGEVMVSQKISKN